MSSGPNDIEAPDPLTYSEEYRRGWYAARLSHDWGADALQRYSLVPDYDDYRMEPDDTEGEWMRVDDVLAALSVPAPTLPALDRIAELKQTIGFLLSVVASGERLSVKEEADIREALRDAVPTPTKEEHQHEG